MAAFGLFTLLSKGGLFDACRKTVAEATPNSGEVQRTVSLSLTLSLFYGVVVTGVVWILLSTGVLPPLYQPYILVLSISIVFANVSSVVQGIFFGLQRELWGQILGVSRQLIYVVSGLLLAYIGHDLWGIFIGYTFSFIIIATIAIWIILKKYPLQIPTVNHLSTQGKTIATYGGYQLIGGMSAAFLYKADILLVEFFRGSTSTALYNSAIVPAEMIWFVPSVIQLAFLQHTASLWSEEDTQAINENVKIGIKYGVLSLTLFGVGLFGLAEPFLQIYFGQEYTGAATTLRVLILGTLFFGLSRVTLPVFQAIGWIRATEFTTLAALVLNISLNVALIPTYGIIGAGIGTAVSYITMFVGNILIWRWSPIKMVTFGWLGRLIFTQGIFTVLFLSILRISDTSPVVSLLIFPPAGLSLFLSINIFAGYIPLSEMKSLIRSQFG
jgi:O-antigen/teichoic acid export membrane protein